MGPGDVPSNNRVQVVPPVEVTEDVEPDDEALPPGLHQGLQRLNGLAKLREQFPDDMIEKLPKPLYKGAWDNKRGANCPVCNGYHVLESCIHLDYVGHANVTNRLLEVDPYWSWEPMAYTEAGTPLFSDGGLWIRLTVCGVTRLGYGDGKSVKEVIGDAIRNAAMRFGVGLDLWAKIDLHAERNPGDGESSARRDGRGSERVRPGGDGGVSGGASAPADAAPEAPNQDALDSLGEVCDSEGIARGEVRSLFAAWLAKCKLPEVDIVVADSQLILDFAAHLIEVSTDPEGSATGSGGEMADEPGGGGVPEPDGGGGGADGAGGQGPVAGEADPTDTSDVEPQPGDLF
jgi:hypothetical protein